MEIERYADNAKIHLLELPASNGVPSIAYVTDLFVITLTPTRLVAPCLLFTVTKSDRKAFHFIF